MSPLVILLLASAGPLIVGLVGMNDDPADDSSSDQDDWAEDATDPVAMVDVGSFIENTQARTGDPMDMEISREADDDAVLVANETVGTARDVSGGEDILAGDTIVITDFDISEDALAVETEDPESTTVAEQVIDEDGLLVHLSNGAVIRLAGLGGPLPDGTVHFVSPATP